MTVFNALRCRLAFSLVFLNLFFKHYYSPNDLFLDRFSLNVRKHVFPLIWKSQPPTPKVLIPQIHCVFAYVLWPFGGHTYCNILKHFCFFPPSPRTKFGSLEATLFSLRMNDLALL